MWASRFAMSSAACGGRLTCVDMPKAFGWRRRNRISDTRSCHHLFCVTVCRPRPPITVERDVGEPDWTALEFVVEDKARDSFVFCKYDENQFIVYLKCERDT